MNNYKKYKVVFTSIFILAMLLPLSNMNPDAKSTNENRKLAAMPVVFKDDAFNPAFTKEVEAWLVDRFSGRDFLINVNRKVEAAIVDQEHPKVIYGKEGWLFLRPGESVENYQNKNLFNDAQLEMIKANILKKKEYLANKGIDYYIFIAPDKNRVYGEYYPDSIKKVAPRGRVELLVDYLRENGIKIIYPLEELMAAKSPDYTLYYRVDTHWNNYGAFIGYKVLMDGIKEDKPFLIKSLDISEFELGYEPESIVDRQPNTGGDLLRMIMQPIEVLGISDNRTALLTKKTPYHYSVTKFKGDYGRDGVVTINETPLNDMKVVMVRDSYCISLLPYISESFSEVHYIWSHEFNAGLSAINKHKPDIVIEELLERYAPTLISNYK